MFRKFTTVAAAIAATVILAGSSCGSSQDTSIPPGASKDIIPTAQPDAPRSDVKPLQDILIESGYSPKEFELSPGKVQAAIEMPGVCPIVVSYAAENTYQIDKIGNLPFRDLPAQLRKTLKGPNPKASTVETAVLAAMEAKHITC